MTFESNSALLISFNTGIDCSAWLAIARPFHRYWSRDVNLICASPNLLEGSSPKPLSTFSSLSKFKG